MRRGGRLHRIGQTSEALAARLLLTLFRSLDPIRRATRTWGAGCVASSVRLLPISRVTKRNLRLAMPELDAAARARIIRGALDNLGRTVAEFPHLARLRSDAPSGWLGRSVALRCSRCPRCPRCRRGQAVRAAGHDDDRALAAIALRQRCPVIPDRIERVGPAQLRLVVVSPLTLPDSGDRTSGQAALMQQINDVLESWI